MKEALRVYIGADHAGFDTKNKLKEHLKNKKYSVYDLSPDFNEGDDYPEHAFEVAKKVAKNRKSKGVLICGSGAGMAIAANKVKGIRAAEAYDSYSAKMSREHNDANVLCLRARNFSINKNKKILGIWLKTRFSNASRHIRRLRKISEHE